MSATSESEPTSTASKTEETGDSKPMSDLEKRKLEMQKRKEEKLRFEEEQRKLKGMDLYQNRRFDFQKSLNASNVKRQKSSKLKN
jgi:hypothetical protein